MTSATKPSMKKLSEVARHLVYPQGIVSSGWPRIRTRLADMAISFDGWQQGAAQIILGRDESGRYVATVGGVTMSIPRQVGKTFTIGSLLVAMCVEYPGLRVVWTSHHLRTTTNTFRSMQGMVRRKRIAPHLAHNGIRTANGEQEIRFANGSIIMFGAREHGFGVGIDAIDVLVCDEAQRLSSRALADMVPTTNQSRHEHGALLFFIGTPPRPDNDGDEFAARRRKALAGKMLNGIYVEMSADKGSDPNDEGQWGRANPSYPHRTPHEAMLRLRENLTDEGDWLREAMGIWDDDDTASVFGDGKWNDCSGEIPAERTSGAVGVAVSVDLSTAAVVLAARSDERVIPLPSGHGPGTDWVIDRAVSVASEQRVPIVIDGGGPGAFLVDNLRKAARKKGVRVVEASLLTMKDACAAIFLQVGAGELLHGDWPEMNAAVSGAVQRTVGDRWLWGRRGQKKAARPPDISLLEAATVALWGQDNARTRSAADQRLAEGGTAVLSI